jgi:antitoxin ParD1/3/4
MKVEMMNVSLTPELAAFVRSMVETGGYTGQSEVVREALRLLKDQGQLRDAQRTAVRDKVERGWQQSERGEVVSGKAVREHFARKSAAHRRKRA